MKYTIVRFEDVSCHVASDVQMNHLWFEIYAGEVMGIIGLSAAERAEITAILSGRKSAAGGRFLINGEFYNAEQTAERLRRIAAYIGPEEVLTDQLSIADNLCVLGRKTQGKGWRRWFVDAENNRRQTAEYLAIAQIKAHPDDPVSSLSAEEKQRLEFIRAIALGARMIVCNSPLNRSELVANEPAFRALCDYARAGGVAVVMVFSNVDRMMRLCDAAVMLRGGMTVCRRERKSFNHSEILHQIMGVSVQQSEPEVQRTPPYGSTLELRGVTAEGFLLRDFSLRVRSGEIIGAICVNDEWNDGFLKFLQGAYPIRQGSVLRNGKMVSQEFLNRVCTDDNRVSFIVGNNNFGLHNNMSILDNLLLPVQSRLAHSPLRLLGDDSYEFGKKICLQNSIVNAEKELDKPVDALSQSQKLRLIEARLRLFHPDLCVMLGVEESVPELSAEIYRICRGLAAVGTGLLLVSTRPYWLRGVCDKILMIRNGRVMHRISRAQFDSINTTQIYRELE